VNEGAVLIIKEGPSDGIGELTLLSEGDGDGDDDDDDRSGALLISDLPANGSCDVI